LAAQDAAPSPIRLTFPRVLTDSGGTASQLMRRCRCHGWRPSPAGAVAAGAVGGGGGGGWRGGRPWPCSMHPPKVRDPAVMSAGHVPAQRMHTVPSAASLKGRT